MSDPSIFYCNFPKFKLLDAQYGPEYKIAAIFTDNDLNMQIHRGMTSEPNSEYTAILSIKDEKNLVNQKV